MWDHTRMAWAIKCIIIGSFVQEHGFSTTVVKEGEDAIIECGLQTRVEEGYLKWEAITNDTTVVLAYDLRDGFSNCNDRIINCTIHTNGSIHLESVSKEDGARYYRCLRGDEDGYNYYSDHRLSVLSKGQMSSGPSIDTTHRGSVSAYKMGKKGVLHGYNAPVCEDDVNGNLPVVCYPPSGIIVGREYETIQCNCTDSDGLMDSVTFPVTWQISSPPTIETRHRESVSSYNIGKKGVLYGYYAPVCEDDVDGNLPVVCYPPSGIIVDREYETIQCNCSDSDGLMDTVTFPVTSVTHGLHPGWRKAFISLLVISILIIFVLILICRIQYKNLKMWKAGKKRDPERRLTLKDYPNVPPQAFKEYLIDDDSECKGFNLAFTCDGTDMRIELLNNEGRKGICQFEFKNGEIIPSYRGKPEKAIRFKQGTKYHLNLVNRMRVLSFSEHSAQGNECVQEYRDYDFLQLSLLCIYKSDTCSVSILSHLGLSELPTPADDPN